jgi:hypothetical protein
MSFDDYANSKIIFQNVRQDVVQPADGDGRTVDLVLWTGQAIFRNGEIAGISGLDSSDGRNGALSFRGHAINVFDDGSTIVSAYEGKSRLKPGSNQFTSEGEWKFTSGTGRFVGIQGSGTFKVAGAGDKGHSECIGKAAKA